MGVSVRVSEGRAKNGGQLVNKQRQRCDVRAQRHDVPEGGGANVVTFQRGYKSNVTTLRSNVATFQKVAKLTSRR